MVSFALDGVQSLTCGRWLPGIQVKLVLWLLVFSKQPVAVREYVLKDWVLMGLVCKTELTLFPDDEGHVWVSIANDHTIGV